MQESSKDREQHFKGQAKALWAAPPILFKCLEEFTWLGGQQVLLDVVLCLPHDASLDVELH